MRNQQYILLNKIKTVERPLDPWTKKERMELLCRKASRTDIESYYSSAKHAKNVIMLVSLATILGLNGCEKEEPKQVTTPDSLSQHSVSATAQPINEQDVPPPHSFNPQLGSTTTAIQPLTKHNNYPALPPLGTVFGGRLKILKTQENGIEWVLAVDYFEGHIGGGIINHEGKNYIKAGISPKMRENQKQWLRGDDNSQGVIYSMEDSGIMHKIQRISIEGDGGLSPIPGVASVLQMTVSIDGQNKTLFIREVIERGKFGWYNESGIIYFSAKEIVPEGYRPLYSLRVRGMEGFDTTEPSPQILDISSLRAYEATHVRLRGIPLASSTGIRDAFVIAPISQLQTERVKIVNHGDGSFELFDRKSTVDGETVQRLVAAPTVIVEPLSENSWNTRKEYFHPYRSPAHLGK